jgi:hypothetical protein
MKPCPQKAQALRPEVVPVEMRRVNRMRQGIALVTSIQRANAAWWRSTLRYPLVYRGGEQRGGYSHPSSEEDFPARSKIAFWIAIVGEIIFYATRGITDPVVFLATPDSGDLL